MRINSGVRCVTWNAKVGGAADSAHLLGVAVDISITNSTDRHEFLSFATAAFHRVGIAEDFIHVDCDSHRPARVAWLYPRSK